MAPGAFQPVSIRPGCVYLILAVHSSATGEPDRRQSHAHPHLTSMTFGAGPVVVLCFGWLSLISRFLLGNLPQPLADLRQLLFAATIGQKPKMANTHQAFGQDVQQKAADQLLTRQLHRLPAILILVVLVAHLDFTLGDRPDSRIADGGAIRVTGQIRHDGFGLSQPGFGVDDQPFKGANNYDLRPPNNLAVDTCGVFGSLIRFGTGFLGPRGCFWNRDNFTFPASIWRHWMSCDCVNL